MNVRYFMILVILIRLSQADNILVEFIKDYYEAINIRQIVIFGCFNYAVELTQSIMKFGTVVTYQSTSKGVDLSTILRVNYYHIGVILDLDCPFSERILDKFSNQLHFNESYNWLVLSTLTQVPSHYLRTLKLTIAAEFTFAIRNDDGFHLHDVYNPSYRHGGSVKIIHKGWWTPYEGLKNELIQYKYIRRNLGGLILNFSTVLVNPPPPEQVLSYLTAKYNIDGTDSMARSHYPMCVYLSHLYNFTLNLHLTTNWGYLVNGTFNGLIGDILTGVIDISVSPFEYRHNRLDFIDYIVPTWESIVIFAFLHPNSLTLKNNFLKPFTDDVWYLVMLVAVVYWIILLVSLVLEMNYKDESSTTSITSPAMETGLSTVAALSQQGVNDSPNLFSGRITFLSLFLWALLLYQFYSASIVSSLLSPPPRWIKTVRDISMSNLDVGTFNIPYFVDLFANSKDPDIIDLYKRKFNGARPTARSTALPCEAGVREIQRGGYAFGTESSTMFKVISDVFTENQICQLHSVPIMKPTKIAPIIAKRSPFREMMIYGWRRIIETGLMAYYTKRWRVSKPQCPESHASEPTAMSLKEFCPALFLLGIGAAISHAIFAIELLYSYVKKQKVSKKIHSVHVTSIVSNDDNDDE